MPEIYAHSTESLEQDIIENTMERHGHADPLANIKIYVFLFITIIFFVFIGIVIAVFVGKCPKKPNSNDVVTNEPLLEVSNSVTTGYIGTHPIQLEKALAHGKFGTVWHATDGANKSIAVKIFSVQDRNSWQIEKDIYNLPRMQHNNILKYLGAERRGEGLDVEYWIITEYHPNGSLHEYLKSHTVNWKQLLTIIQGIGRGLAHLHSISGATINQEAKPSIAHRDFKSKNVLLGCNFRACIADFGLALVFYPNTTCGDAHGQVGTRRYMAPEVLEGAINFTSESFLKIDMYACGLVMWELISRCCFGEFICQNYALPFENEVGLNPSIEDMQEIVAQQKKRPKIQESWYKHPGMASIVNTIQDCWDQEAEARISAETICERINSLILSNESQSNI
ncbi:hypothetical protein SSS_05339 [Sarcoptes scabiei]|nr:hypothetical protein SSS_05339 [Sarcoptes scabiei]